MTSDRLLRVLVKTERAYQHVTNLHARLKAFLDTSPYQIIIDDDSETGDRVFRVRKIADVPIEINAILGDAIHNLRSALDHLVCQLVEVNGGKAGTQTAYPIYDTSKEYMSKSPRKIKGMSGAAAHFIDATEPYKEGLGHDIWRLHRLDIVDKHRLLITVGGFYPFRALDFNTLFHRRHPHLTDRRVPIIPVPMQKQSIIEDGAEIHRVPKFAERPDIHTEPKFPPTIAINEPAIGHTEPVFDTLKTLCETVDAVIEQCARFL
jgi:hypothetical protein